MVWGVLLSRRLVSEQVGSTQYRVFENDMADLSDNELRNGMNKAKDFTGFFTFPAFRELCRIAPADLGLPDVRVAYVEAASAQGDKTVIPWSHPAVYWAGVETGWWDLANRTEHEIFPLFRQNYEIMVKRAMTGDALNVPTQKALPPKQFIPASKEKSMESISRLKAMLG